MKKFVSFIRNFLVISTITFVILEITLRLMLGFETNKFVFTKTEAGYIARFKPNASFIHEIENINGVALNNLGFHDKTYTQEGDSLYRIGFIGDSFVAGYEVPLTDAFTTKLNQELNTDTHKYSCYNFGTPGTASAYQYVLYNSLLKDVVDIDHMFICVFLDNDFYDNSPYRDSYRRFDWVIDTNGVSQKNNSYSVFRKAIDFTRSYSVAINTLYEFAYETIKNTSHTNKSGNEDPEIAQFQKFTAHDSTVVKMTIDLIANWISELKIEGIKADVIVFRSDYNFLARENYFNTQIKSKSEDIGFNVVDVRFSKPDLKHFEFEDEGVMKLGHFNELGHDSVSDILFQYIKQLN